MNARSGAFWSKTYSLDRNCGRIKCIHKDTHLATLLSFKEDCLHQVKEICLQGLIWTMKWIAHQVCWLVMKDLNASILLPVCVFLFLFTFF